MIKSILLALLVTGLITFDPCVVCIAKNKSTWPKCKDSIGESDLQVRVGNSTEPGDNQLCNWIPKEIEEGATEVLDCYEDLVGR